MSHSPDPSPDTEAQHEHPTDTNSTPSEMRHDPAHMQESPMEKEMDHAAMYGMSEVMCTRKQITRGMTTEPTLITLD